ncbi:hypothetical protein HYC85_032102 [Camellia sinensis]|uniref:HMA domain-containing protein n=1 Tax=Camellia sinensis TaxID=4442 RepID=A0A7J7FSJ0_CAMSI|nr:hypothetical protein HYC85_032102 [Camellia sinensis]
MEVNGEDDLKAPLLQSSDSVAISVSRPTHNGDKKIKTIMFKVRGIECASCSNSIESALGKLSGVQNVMVSPLEGQAVAKTIKETVEDAGFQVDEFPEQDIAVCRLRIKGNGMHKLF